MAVLLTLDVGNTNIVIGAFQGPALIHSWRIATSRERTADELGVVVTNLCRHHQVGLDDIEGIVIASVVPPLAGTLVRMATDYFGHQPLMFDPAADSVMPILYDNPSDVGADRIVNALAAVEACGPGTPIIVVDFGTATTFDAISAAGEYLGGVICPGPQISAEALFQRAARLPRIDVRKPAHVIGTNTVGSMQAGLFWGYVDMVEGIVRRVREELGGTAVVVATGGLASVVAPESSLIDRVDDDLTLRGLRLIWERRDRP